MNQKLSRQPSLFDQPASAVPKRPPNLDFIRKHLKARLRMVRESIIMPWHKADADYWERFFPELARLLPPEEGEALIADFKKEIARIKAANQAP